MHAYACYFLPLTAGYRTVSAQKAWSESDFGSLPGQGGLALVDSLCWLLKYLRSCATAATVVFVVFVYDHYFSILMWLGVGAFFISASLNGLEDRTIVGSRGSFAGLLVSSSVS